MTYTDAEVQRLVAEARVEAFEEAATRLNGELMDHAAIVVRALSDAPPRQAFQDRVKPWMDACFGAEISADRVERGDRLLEEVFELLQSGDYPRERVAQLASYVWSRPEGEPAQEVGGVMVTLAAYCLAHGIDMHEAGEVELSRIWTKVEKIRAKQAAKPTGSALPQVWPQETTPRQVTPQEAAIMKLLKSAWDLGYEHGSVLACDTPLACRDGECDMLLRALANGGDSDG